MSFESPSAWITANEYRNGLPDRAQISELQSGMRYALISLLAQNSFGLEAHRNPVECKTIQRVGDIAVVNFIVISPKINGPFPPGVKPPEDKICSGNFDGGFIDFENYSLPVPIRQSYLSFDMTGLDDALDGLFVHQQLSRYDLVGVS